MQEKTDPNFIELQTIRNHLTNLLDHIDRTRFLMNTRLNDLQDQTRRLNIVITKAIDNI